MRIHPISLALKYLKGQKTIYGRVLFTSSEDAAASLGKATGLDFGQDAAAWGAWLRANRWIYISDLSEDCAVHGCLTYLRPVKIAYGFRSGLKLSPNYVRARRELFPNCDDTVNGGCMLISSKRTMVKPTCAACNVARDEYLRPNHPRRPKRSNDRTQAETKSHDPQP